MKSPVNRVALALVMLVSCAAFALASSFDVHPRGEAGTETTGGAPMVAVEVVGAPVVDAGDLIARLDPVQLAGACAACVAVLVSMHIDCGASVYSWGLAAR